MIRRINLFGGPGCGKSTMAAMLFARFKEQRRNVELVQEYVKTWAFEHRAPVSFDQVYVFAKQMHHEDILLRSGVDLVICDSPVFLTTCYGRKNDVPGWRGLVEVSREFDAVFPPLDVLLDRKDRPYSNMGRFQTKAEAREMDDLIKLALEERGSPFSVIAYDDPEEVILAYVSSTLSRRD